MGFTLSCSYFSTFLQWVVMFDVHCGDTLHYTIFYLLVLLIQMFVCVC